MTLLTSIEEIHSFNPCALGYRAICKAQKPRVSFPIAAALESNSISDVLWLLGKRKKEISIAVEFAQWCAYSVAHLKNSKYVVVAADVAADAATAADAADAGAYAAAAATAADAAAYAAAYAGAYAAAYAGADAAGAHADARQKQKEKLADLLNNFQQ